MFSEREYLPVLIEKVKDTPNFYGDPEVTDVYKMLKKR